MERPCDECGRPYIAKTRRSRFCGVNCRVRANKRPSKRGSAAAAAELEEPPLGTPARAVGLMDQVRADLGAIEALDTIPGRAALALAYRIESPLETGSAAAQMTRELSRLVEEAQAAVAPKRRDAGDEISDRVAAKLRVVP